ncbi:MAG TPA: cytochrome c [Terriglobia bacterium]|nr:cytochrome c [Terriglobia bacterium]
MDRPLTVFPFFAAILILMLSGGLSSKMPQLLAAQAGRSGDKTVWDGVYAAGQAIQGRTNFAANCSECHGDELTGVEGPALKGDSFMSQWGGDSLNALFDRMKTMPPGREKLTEDVYLTILAYILDANAFPASTEELKANVLDSVRITSKDGSGVPNFALVQIVGCLAQGADNTWILTNASDPIRTRNPDKPAAEELKAAAARPLGTQTFKLLSPESFTSGFRIDSYKGHKMEAKGLLIRTANDVRLNVTWLETIASTCP